jgi:hypothetical protein
MLVVATMNEGVSVSVSVRGQREVDDHDGTRSVHCRGHVRGVCAVWDWCVSNFECVFSLVYSVLYGNTGTPLSSLPVVPAAAVSYHTSLPCFLSVCLSVCLSICL